MPDRVRLRLHDALQACDELAEFTAGKSLANYLQDTKLRRAVERSLEIVGDALGNAIRIEPELEVSIPDAVVIVGMRNRIAHGYREIKDDVVWESATVGAPQLAVSLRALLNNRDGT